MHENGGRMDGGGDETGLGGNSTGREESINLKLTEFRDKC